MGHKARDSEYKEKCNRGHKTFIGTFKPDLSRALPPKWKRRNFSKLSWDIMPITALENPRGLRSITPYLFVQDPDKLIDFLKRAFNAEQTLRGVRPDGTVMHAEVKIGDSSVMMGSPIGRFGPLKSSIYLYVKDCDAVYRQAVEAGGVSVMEPDNMMTGERYGAVTDPAGNIWWIATHIENPSSEEVAKRFKTSFPHKSSLKNEAS